MSNKLEGAGWGAALGIPLTSLCLLLPIGFLGLAAGPGQADVDRQIQSFHECLKVTGFREVTNRDAFEAAKARNEYAFAVVEGDFLMWPEDDEAKQKFDSCNH